MWVWGAVSVFFWCLVSLRDDNSVIYEKQNKTNEKSFCPSADRKSLLVLTSSIRKEENNLITAVQSPKAS
jgi:hypothetical protein